MRRHGSPGVRARPKPRPRLRRPSPPRPRRRRKRRPSSRRSRPRRQKEQKVEEKKPGEKKIDVVVKTATETIPLEITIVQGDQTKTIKLSDAWTLKEGPEGKVLILSPGGKELKLSEGGPIRIEIKGDKLEHGHGAGQDREEDHRLREIPTVDVFKLREDAAKSILRKSIEIDVRDTEKLQDVIRKKIAVEIDAAKLKELAETHKEIAAALAEKKAKIAVEIDADKLKELAEKRAVIVTESGKLRDEIKKATALALAEAKEAQSPGR